LIARKLYMDKTRSTTFTWEVVGSCSILYQNLEVVLEEVEREALLQ
jgi:hypothetical protein